MKLKKKRKAVRMRGSRTHGWAMKKHKGSGNRGGKGMAGAGKRAKHKKTYVTKHLYPYFGKQGFTSRGTAVRKNEVINLRDIEKNILSFEKNGIVKKIKEGISIELKEHKILGEGELNGKYIITASGFSNSAKKKIEEAGGMAVVWKEVRKIQSKTGEQ